MSDFTEHCGGECPVAPDAWVEPQFRDEADPAKGIRRSYGRAWQFVWRHDGDDDDIVGYRLLEPPVSPTPKGLSS